jgi:hypothetical protein
MHRELDMAIIFPMQDAASAALMAVKADCLRGAGVINEQQKQCVDSKVRTYLEPDCRFPPP